MLKLASDEDAHGSVLSGLRICSASLDLVRVIDVGLGGHHDLEILAWTASENRVLITNDMNSMVGFAYQRILEGESVPGVIVMTHARSIAEAIEDILTIADCMTEEEIRDQVLHLPL